MKVLKQSILDIEKKLAFRTIREKIMILVVFVVLIYLLMEALFLKPLVQTISTKHSLIAEQEQTLQALVLTQQQSDESALHIESKLENEIKELTHELKEARKSVYYGIRAQEVLLVLETLFKADQTIDFQEMKNNPSSALGDANILYGHPIELVFQGKFHDLLTFMKKIEFLGLPIIYESMHYEVQTYPLAQLNLRINLLTQSQAFLEF